jgi:ABC-type Fe3+/spermidine/putrescine transport system ATPase subunit
VTALPARLVLSRVSKAYGGARAVDDVSLAVAEGSFVTLLGASGCGKTTLLRIAAGFTAPDAGAVLIDGEDATARPPGARGMAFVFQSYALFPTKTVAENIGFALSVAGVGRAAREARVREVAALVAIGPLLARFPHELSGGQQQRVALARAIAPNPRVLLLDEPLAALDAAIRARLRDEIRALTDKLGMTTLYVTHDQEEALAISDRIVVMRDGRIAQEGEPDEIYHRPACRFVAGFVGTATLLEADAAGGIVRAAGIAWPTGPTPPPDGPCLVVVRPEDLAPAGPGQALEGTVTAQRFLGAVRRVTLRLASGDLVVADMRARSPAVLPGQVLRLAPAAAPAIVPR